ncbi:cyclase family protein [Propionimicrobium sp. PCR01-08-3]|uniref:cyclase family protein n=1 Tax=Propionimicrobium sp. PCR01-08-3 TaxID=3052086 RepID=UPI00255CD522|nr:cyclase family protein [Propionimicrobium sp. PCR01-08-3]WIY81731.1 cyclase family protein [Propionimicrobium sp. PCR01-08-3]
MPNDSDLTMSELLKDAPKNWGRWGEDDEFGALNFLDASEALRGVASAHSGKVFTLQTPVGTDKGDPVTLSRHGAIRRQTVDVNSFRTGDRDINPGGSKWADDYFEMFCQGTSQYDGLGHVWYDEQIYNGYSAETTAGGLSKASVAPVGRHGIVGRGVLLDMARYRDKEYLDRFETFGLDDLLECAKEQGVQIEKHDIILIRTGWIPSYFHRDPEEYFHPFSEPGLVYSKELVEWFHDMEIPNLVTDTMGNEITFDPNNGFKLLLHAALMRNLGVTMCELVMMDELGDDCAKDGQYTFLYAAAPIVIEKASGSPVNPIVVK